MTSYWRLRYFGAYAEAIDNLCRIVTTKPRIGRDRHRVAVTRSVEFDKKGVDKPKLCGILGV